MGGINTSTVLSRYIFTYRIPDRSLFSLQKIIGINKPTNNHLNSIWSKHNNCWAKTLELFQFCCESGTKIYTYGSTITNVQYFIIFEIYLSSPTYVKYISQPITNLYRYQNSTINYTNTNLNRLKHLFFIFPKKK